MLTQAAIRKPGFSTRVLPTRSFYALDAATGHLLWRFQTGAGINGNGNPITYLSNGKQQVAIASGNSVFVFALE